MIYKIYKLIHNGLPVYVGQTKNTLSRRKSCGYKNTSVEHIAKDCSIELIEETDDMSRESYWIDELSKSYNLLNIQKGVTGLSVSEYKRENNKE